MTKTLEKNIVPFLTDALPPLALWDIKIGIFLFDVGPFHRMEIWDIFLHFLFILQAFKPI